MQPDPPHAQHSPPRPESVIPAAPVFDALRLAQVTIQVLAANGDSAQALARRQATRLAAVVDAARAGSRLYRERLRGIEPGRTPLADWPTVTKAELMSRFDDWVTDPELRLPALREFVADRRRIAEPMLGRYQVWESSGSSGEPAVFVQDAQAMAVYDALESLRRPWLRQHWLDPLCLAERIAFVGAIDGHFASYVSMLRLQRINPWLGGRLRCLSILQPTEALAAQLQAFSPTVIASYPSAASLLADEVAAGRLAIRPREVWTGGETLSDAVREHVQRVFGCPLSNSYGASEFLAIGWQCAAGRMHANTDWVLLEPVDDELRPVPPGERSSTTLLTHLAQHVQPLIRYDLGDQLTIAEQRCKCGSPLPVIEVQGRCDDSLVMAGRGGRKVTLLPLALATVLEDEAGLFDFELTQRDPNTLVLRLPLSALAAEAALARGCAALLRFIGDQGVHEPKVVGECGCPTPRGRSGKARRISAGPVA